MSTSIDDYYFNHTIGQGFANPDLRIVSLKEVYEAGVEAALNNGEIHRRDFYEIGLIFRDSSRLIISGEEYQNWKDNITFISPDQEVSFHMPDKEMIKGDDAYLVLFRPSFFEPSIHHFELMHRFSFFSQYTSPAYPLSKEDFNELQQIITRMMDELRNPGAYSEEILRNYLSILLYSCKRITEENQSNLEMSRWDEITYRYEDLLIKQGLPFRSIAYYADLLSITPVYLSECVRRSASKSAKQLLLEHKVVAAKVLLMDKRKSIAQVAEELYFSEVTNFVKFFREKTHSTPHQFRKNFAL